jgi:hypothetical protein
MKLPTIAHLSATRTKLIHILSSKTNQNRNHPFLLKPILHVLAVIYRYPCGNQLQISPFCIILWNIHPRHVGPSVLFWFGRFEKFKTHRISSLGTSSENFVFFEFFFNFYVFNFTLLDEPDQQC